MTNLITAIIITVSTNWVTISRMTPVYKEGPSYTMPSFENLHQIGARVTNTVLVAVWNGKTNQFVLEHTTPFYEGDLSRDIIVSPIHDPLTDKQ